MSCASERHKKKGPVWKTHEVVLVLLRSLEGLKSTPHEHLAHSYAYNRRSVEGRDCEETAHNREMKSRLRPKWPFLGRMSSRVI